LRYGTQNINKIENQRNIPLDQVWKGYVMKIKHKIWFEAHGLTIFGPGRNAFFKQIDECRSLNSAAKKLHISYRLAWGKIKVAEERLGINLVEVNPGEKKMHLTEDARELLAIFDALEKKISPILQEAESKIVALKENSLKNEVSTVNESSETKAPNNGQSVFVKPQNVFLNTLKKYVAQNPYTGENEKNLLKSIGYLYLLPLIDMAYEIFEDYSMLICF